MGALGILDGKKKKKEFWMEHKETYPQMSFTRVALGNPLPRPQFHRLN